MGELIKWFMLFPWRVIVYLLAYIYLIFSNVTHLSLILKLTLMPKRGNFPKIIKPYTGIIIGRGAKVGLLRDYDDLIQFRQVTAQKIASQTRLERQQKIAQNEANKWQERFEIAQEQGDESLAQKALERHQISINEANNFSVRIEQEAVKVEGTKRKLFNHEYKILDAKEQSNLEMTYLAQKLAEGNIS